MSYFQQGGSSSGFGGKGLGFRVLDLDGKALSSFSGFSCFETRAFLVVEIEIVEAPGCCLDVTFNKSVDPNIDPKIIYPLL